MIMRVDLAFLFLSVFIFQLLQMEGVKDLESKYSVGGGGEFNNDLNFTWWRDWDASYNYLPGEGGRPPNKMWTVGKIDYRLDGPPGSSDTSPANIDLIFDYEKDKISELITSGFTGQYWEIGNEPNWRPYFQPADYAYQFQLFCNFIKDLDPSAKCLMGGITLYDPVWQDWMEEFFTSYRKMYQADPVIDLWNIHPYDEFDEWAGQRSIKKIEEFRAYAPEGPIWITEFGKPGWTWESEESIILYINIVCDWLNKNHERYHIERWFWWGVKEGERGMGSNGLFATSPYSHETITGAGQAYLEQRENLTNVQGFSPSVPLVYFLPMINKP